MRKPHDIATILNAIGTSHATGQLAIRDAGLLPLFGMTGIQADGDPRYSERARYRLQERWRLGTIRWTVLPIRDAGLLPLFGMAGIQAEIDPRYSERTRYQLEERWRLGAIRWTVGSRSASPVRHSGLSMRLDRATFETVSANGEHCRSTVREVAIWPAPDHRKSESLEPGLRQLQQDPELRGPEPESHIQNGH